MTPQPIIMGYASGKTCWAMSFHPDGRVLDVNAKAWVSFVLANLANYVMPYAELTSTGKYQALYPSGFVLDVLPTEVSYQQAGVAPALPDDLPIISIGQSQGASVAAVAYSVQAAQNLQANADAMEQGVVQSGANSNTQVVTNLSAASSNIYNGRIVIFTSGIAARCAGIITGFDSTTKILTFTAINSVPSPADSFLVA